MPMWLQHLLVLLIVGVCVALIVRQGVRTFRGRKSKLGACCAKGCEPEAKAERAVFLPSEMLTSSSRRSNDA